MSGKEGDRGRQAPAPSSGGVSLEAWVDQQRLALQEEREAEKAEMVQARAELSPQASTIGPIRALGIRALKSRQFLPQDCQKLGFSLLHIVISSTFFMKCAKCLAQSERSDLVVHGSRHQHRPLWTDVYQPGFVPRVGRHGATACEQVRDGGRGDADDDEGAVDRGKATHHGASLTILHYHMFLHQIDLDMALVQWTHATNGQMLCPTDR
jgi:hypothetical protein